MTQYKPSNPLWAIIDHLSNRTSTATHYFKTFDSAFDAAVEEHGIEVVKEFVNQDKYKDIVQDKLDETFETIEFFSLI
jgi:protoheme ferro-lyase